jgi:hypothetical protein
MGFRDVLPKEADRILMQDTIQQWRSTRAQRLEMDKQAKLMKRRELEIKSWLIEAFKEQLYEGIMIDQRITGLSKKEISIVEDRAAFINYIYENEAIDLLQFRISESAIKERQENGEDVPGVSESEVYDLFDRKA